MTGPYSNLEYFIYSDICIRKIELSQGLIFDCHFFMILFDLQKMTICHFHKVFQMTADAFMERKMLGG